MFYRYSMILGVKIALNKVIRLDLFEICHSLLNVFVKRAHTYFFFFPLITTSQRQIIIFILIHLHSIIFI